MTVQFGAFENVRENVHQKVERILIQEVDLNLFLTIFGLNYFVQLLKCMINLTASRSQSLILGRDAFNFGHNLVRFIRFRSNFGCFSLQLFESFNNGIIIENLALALVQCIQQSLFQVTKTDSKFSLENNYIKILE